jgi:hypothetical protein
MNIVFAYKTIDKAQYFDIGKSKAILSHPGSSWRRQKLVRMAGMRPLPPDIDGQGLR